MSKLVVLSVLVGGVLATSPALAVDGAAVYNKLCVSCHGADGTGNADKAKALNLDPKLLDLTSPEAMKKSREEQKTVLLKGRNKMPSYEKKLKADEVEPVLDHVAKLQKAAKK